MKMYLKEIPCINKVDLPYPEGSDVTWRHRSAILNFDPTDTQFQQKYSILLFQNIFRYK